MLILWYIAYESQVFHLDSPEDFKLFYSPSFSEYKRALEIEITDKVWYEYVKYE